MMAPVTQQFAGFGNIFIMPDQAAVAASYNANNPLIPTTDEGAQPRHEGDTGSVEVFWPCVGAERIVPDYMSLFPGSGQNAPFAGATRPLCDRKEVTLDDQIVGAGEVLRLHLDPRRRPLHRHHHRRFHVGIRPVLAGIRREVLAALPAGFRQGLGWKRSLPRVCRSVGNLQRLELTRAAE